MGTFIFSLLVIGLAAYYGFVVAPKQKKLQQFNSAAWALADFVKSRGYAPRSLGSSRKFFWDFRLIDGRNLYIHLNGNAFVVQIASQMFSLNDWRGKKLSEEEAIKFIQFVDANLSAYETPVKKAKRELRAEKIDSLSVTKKPKRRVRAAKKVVRK